MTNEEVAHALRQAFENRTIEKVVHRGAHDDLQCLFFHLDDTSVVQVRVGDDCLVVRRKFNEGESVPVVPRDDR